MPGLVRIEGTVAPGASGAPVVDDDAMAVRGFVVAGGVDGPPGFMYPSSAWARAVQLAAEPGGH